MPAQAAQLPMSRPAPTGAETLEWLKQNPSNEPTSPPAAAAPSGAETLDWLKKNPSDQIEQEQTQQQETPPSRLGAFLAGSAGNIPKSYGRFIQPFIHPLETAKSAYEVATAPSTMAMPPFMLQFKALNNVFQNYKNRYGSWEAVKNTIYNDPVGFLADASAALSPVADVAGVAGLPRTAGALAATSRYIDPLTAPLRVGEATLARPGAWVGTQTIGRLTGAGPAPAEDVLRQGVRGRGILQRPPREFTDALRGQTTIDQIANNLHNTMEQYRDRMQQNYRGSPMHQAMQGMTLNAIGVPQRLVSELNNYGVGIKQVWNNNLGRWTPVPDFSGALSKIGPSEEQGIRDLVHTVLVDQPTRSNASWTAMPADHLDALKIRLDKEYRQAKGAPRSMIGAVREDVRAPLSQVPFYDTNMREYQLANDYLENFSKELSQPQGQRLAVGTAARKLNYAMNQNMGYRMSLIDRMDQAMGSHIRDQLAGYAMSNWAPRGLIGPLSTAELGSAITYALMNGLNVNDLLHAAAASAVAIPTTAAVTSPRIMGETLLKAGQLYGTARKAAGALPPAAVYRPITYSRPNMFPPNPLPPGAPPPVSPGRTP